MKTGIIIIGKIPPPYFGPAVATQILLNSSLKDVFELSHVDTRLNKGIQTMGKFQLKKILFLFGIYFRYLRFLFNSRNKIVLLPIAQESSALYKDLIFLALGRLFRKKVVLHLRGSALLNWYQNTSGWNKWLFKKAFSKASAGIVLGENLRYLFEPFLPASKIHVVPNGADFQFPEKQENSKLEILYFANLMRNKGLDLLLDALAILPDNLRNNWHCTVVGSWENEQYREFCEAIIQKNKLPVSIFPPMGGADKLHCFANADLFVFTPRAPEGHPWVLVEAMAAALPIISSNQGAISESVKDGYNGFIVAHQHPKELAEKLQLFLEKPELLQAMGTAGKTLYLEQFTEEKMLLRLTTVFNQILK